MICYLDILWTRKCQNAIIGAMKLICSQECWVEASTQVLGCMSINQDTPGLCFVFLNLPGSECSGTHLGWRMIPMLWAMECQVSGTNNQIRPRETVQAGR